MSKEGLVGILGFWLVVLPYLGIPYEWKQLLTTATGVILLVVVYLLLRDRFNAQIHDVGGERETDTFVETTKPLFEDK